MTLAHGLLLFGAGALANAINAVAGGGSLITFPLLRFGFKMDSVVANATNTSSLWPGSLGGALGFLNLLPKTKPYLKLLLVPTTLGAALGAWLLVVTPKSVFDAIVPFLILLAAVLLLIQPQIKGLVLKSNRAVPPWLGVVLQTIVSIYGGYFGAGMGIMMLASFSLYMDGTIHELNAIKSWLGMLINLVASVLLLGAGKVDLGFAGWLIAGSVVGGYLAAKYSQGLHPEGLRKAVAVYSIAMALYYFWASR
ncbi:sulfite exporter TauE/SafE family protein [bacterium]|nr:MAG: sulfite exporter TauE/SafE family protein [bacterium]